MTWLVTGGAGYIGSHVVRALVESGRSVVVLDDLSSGHREFVAPEITLVNGSIADRTAVDEAFAAAKATGDGTVSGVVNLAGFKYAGVSVQRPLHTYIQNVTGMQVLLQAMLDADVPAMVFSSSAATYGTPDVDLVTETTPTNPESPYGQSKLIGEWLLKDVATASPGFKHTSLRYFNVVGSGYPDLYDTSPHNLFPRILAALTAGETPSVMGTDYPTPDGSCVRDYVHVQDVALAHVAAVDSLEHDRPIETVYNLGSGSGLSVLEIMSSVARVTGQPFTPNELPRRPGDPARIVASGELATRDLDWKMRHDVDSMVRSAWEAWTSAQQPA
jgi:UDP-glucose 4-epimerase